MVIFLNIVLVLHYIIEKRIEKAHWRTITTLSSEDMRV